MRKIYFNGRFLTQPITGVQRYARELLTALDQELTKPRNSKFTGLVELFLVTPIGYGHELGLRNFKIIEVGRKGSHLWEQTSLPRVARRNTIVNLCNSGPLFSKGITVLHDAAIYRHPENYSNSYVWAHKFIDSFLKRFSRIVTVSNFSRGEISDVLGLDSAEISVVGNGSEHFARLDADDSVIDKFNLSTRKYFVLIGSKSLNKNLKTAIAAHRSLTDENVYLVVVGDAGDAFRVADGMQTSSNVISAGRLADGEIKALLTHSSGLVFPSKYEGFGIPPLEAMICGAPVLASDIPACREVCGDAAVYFRPEDTEQLSLLMSRLVSDHELRDRLIENGQVRRSLFSWRVEAQKLIEILSV